MPLSGPDSIILNEIPFLCDSSLNRIRTGISKQVDLSTPNFTNADVNYYAM